MIQQTQREWILSIQCCYWRVGFNSMGGKPFVLSIKLWSKVLLHPLCATFSNDLKPIQQNIILQLVQVMWPWGSLNECSVYNNSLSVNLHSLAEHVIMLFSRAKWIREDFVEYKTFIWAFYLNKFKPGNESQYPENCPGSCKCPESRFIISQTSERGYETTSQI